MPATSRLQRSALIVVFLWFLLGGIAHFVMPTAFVRIVPPSLPYPLQIVYFTGLLELMGAIALCISSLRHAAAWALMLLTVCVTPANIYMWLHAEEFPHIPAWALLLRLPLQLLLLWVIWRVTQSSAKPATR